MWCPEGYVTLREILDGFYREADSVGSSMDRPDLLTAPGEFAIDTGLDHIETNALVNWLLRGFFYYFGQHVKVCAPSGTILRISCDFWNGIEADDSAHLDIYEIGFPSSYAGRRAVSEWNFSFLEMRTGCIQSGVSEYFPFLSPLSGLPLCIQTSALPVDGQRLASWLLTNHPPQFPFWDGNREDDWGDVEDPGGKSTQATKGGRPKLHQEIVRAFGSAFPHGMAGNPLTKVAEKLGYDRKTVRTALQEAGLYRRIGR